MQHRNRSSRKEPKKESQFMRFFIPAILTILFHLSFLGFKKASPPATTDRVALKQVMLLPQDSVNPGEQRLLAWLNMLDASYVIQPDIQHGFSAIFYAPEVHDIPLHLNNQFMNDEEGATDFLPVPWQDSGSRLRRLWGHPSLNITPVDPKYYKRVLNYPVWLNEEDQVLPQLFDNIDEIKASIKKSPPPQSETVLKVTFLNTDVFPKVEVVYSCGIPSLDREALRTFTVKSENTPINAEKRIVPYFITVKWCSE